MRVYASCPRKFIACPGVTLKLANLNATDFKPIGEFAAVLGSTRYQEVIRKRPSQRGKLKLKI